MIVKNKNRILVYLLIILSICALMIGLTVSNQTGSVPAAADQTRASESVEEPYVVYEAVFLDTTEILEVFQNIRGEEAPYELSPADYHITVTFLPSVASYDLYGAKVIANGISYKAGDVPKDEGGLTQNEGLLVKLQSDNPGFRQLINSIHTHPWHITGSFSDKPKYTAQLDFSNAEPVMCAISGTFGAFMSDGSFRFTPEKTAAFADSEANGEDENTTSQISLYLWDDVSQNNRVYTDTLEESIQEFSELYDLLYSQTGSSIDLLVLEEGYDSIQDGLLYHAGRSLSFLNQTVIFKNETYKNAWYLEVFSKENNVRKCIILPESSRYAQMLKQLLDRMHYQELINELKTGKTD